MAAILLFTYSPRKEMHRAGFEPATLDPKVRLGASELPSLVEEESSSHSLYGDLGSPELGRSYVDVYSSLWLPREAYEALLLHSRYLCDCSATRWKLLEASWLWTSKMDAP